MEFTLRPATADDFEFAFEVKRDALGPYVAERWGWDDALQIQHHQKQWVDKPWQVILCAGVPVGTVSVHWKATHLQFGEFYITVFAQTLTSTLQCTSSSSSMRSHSPWRLLTGIALTATLFGIVVGSD